MSSPTPNQILEWSDEDSPFEYEYTNYCDGPMSGWAVFRSSGQVFAYACDELIEKKIWHWTFVESRTGDRPEDVMDFMRRARGTPGLHWLSVIEDRRASPGRFIGVWTDGPLDEL